MPSSRFRARVCLVVLLVLAVPAALVLMIRGRLTRAEPRHFADPVEQFKYGPMGNVEAQGMPFYVWYVLPRVFGEHLPGNGGYASFGFPSEQGHEVPVGFSRQTVGFPRIAFNCAVCHTTSYRTSADGSPTLVLAGPGHTQDTQGYVQFLFRCAADPRFTADVLLREIEENFELSWLDRLLYRHAIIPATREALLEQQRRSEWMSARPRWGPGRVDAFNAIKFEVLGMRPDETVGTADSPPIWRLRARRDQRLRWDGCEGSLRGSMLTSALGEGATLASLDVGGLARIEDWLLDVQPPAYPGQVDRARARRGREVFARLCHDCHGEGGKTAGAVVPIGEIGTDPKRLAVWSEQAAELLKTFIAGESSDLHDAVATTGPSDGYVAMPLAGPWLLGPYLHNGSVPSLVDLLAEPYGDALPREVASISPAFAELPRRELRRHSEELRAIEAHVRAARAEGRRPAMFFRGYDLLDREHVGFVSDRGTIGEEPQPFVFDTRLPGNGNGGHAGPRYGTTLPPDEKAALIEYLKTL
ncbi:hypothetical protein [Nannocystis sp. SCPEA4]|uniref:c-type cytochrome n=1 Tax=Nannocystis sp. SCPEA4 TaxID=2996787 RepID=UPI002270ED32|nr:hypothetical protein [Nannocystis sp. SCPEA4]MCY1059385.1 hypothetical protein [Nannocystis sp. SCPEA4]